MSGVQTKLNYATTCLTAILIFSFVLAYFPVWKTLITTWKTSDQYSHGFLILPLCLYVVWRKKECLAKLPASPSPWGLGIIIFSLSVYIVVHFAEVVTIASLSMVLLIAGIIVYLYGFQMLKELLFPLSFLLFMIPVPAQIFSALTIPLQLFVTKASTWIAALFAIPVYHEGNVIHLPDRTLQVVQACSGLRSFISLLALSAIFGYFTLRSNFLRAALFVFGAPAAILVNIIRVLVFLLAFYYFDLDLSTDGLHTLFGVSIFVLALISIILMKGILSNWDTHAIAK